MIVPRLTLISHALCPYVQRAVIALAEKSTPFERIDVDLAAKPDWFLALSPLGKTPVLRVGETPIFESAVIVEYLEETTSHPLHPADPLARAEHRSWIEFASAILSDIAAFYAAPGAEAFMVKTDVLKKRFGHIERRLSGGPYFDGPAFSLVDVAFAPVFRYFDVFDRIGDFGIVADKPKTNAWRKALAARPSVRRAVGADYELRLRRFLQARGSHLSLLMRSEVLAARAS